MSLPIDLMIDPIATPMRIVLQMKSYLKIAVLLLATGVASISLAASPVKSLTSGSQDFWPCFSPDGGEILFSRLVGETWLLFLVPVAGGQPQQLARSPLAVSATRANWSKANNLIAFTGTSSRGEGSIWIIDSEGSNPHELKSDSSSDRMFYPSWFPTGNQIAAMDAGNLVIKRIDVSSGVTVTVTNHDQVFSGKAAVSPNGDWIAFAGQKNTGQKYDQTKNSIWLVDNTGAARHIELKPGQGRAPTWSPNGEQLAFESNRGSTRGIYAIFIINRDGTGLVQVTPSNLDAQHPAWSPNGRQLAFSAGASNNLVKERRIAIIDIPVNR